MIPALSPTWPGIHCGFCWPCKVKAQLKKKSERTGAVKRICRDIVCSPSSSEHSQNALDRQTQPVNPCLAPVQTVIELEVDMVETPSMRFRRHMAAPSASQQ